MKTYLVGGAVRDEIMGLKSKDLDYSVVLDENDMAGFSDPYSAMRHILVDQGYKIYVETEEHFTIRAKAPNGDDADFVLAREEGPYTDGRRPDWVKAGTLLMDQQRRDFTMNAIAMTPEGEYIDPFNGREDISKRIIRAVGDPKERILEDALRAVRALRFSITKRFRIEGTLIKVLMFDTDVHDAIVEKISDDRVKDELSKMFRFDSIASMKLLSEYQGLTHAMFSGNVSLDATLKTKGRR